MIAADLDLLLRVAQRVADGERLTVHLMEDEGVSVELRLLLAATALTAADCAVTADDILVASLVARPLTDPHHRRVLDEVERLIPGLIEAQMERLDVTLPSVSAQRQLAAVRRDLAEERTRRMEVESQMSAVSSYANELHVQLREQREAAIREQVRRHGETGDDDHAQH